VWRIAVTALAVLLLGVSLWVVIKAPEGKPAETIDLDSDRSEAPETQLQLESVPIDHRTAESVSAGRTSELSAVFAHARERPARDSSDSSTGHETVRGHAWSSAHLPLVDADLRCLVAEVVLDSVGKDRGVPMSSWIRTKTDAQGEFTAEIETRKSAEGVRCELAMFFQDPSSDVVWRGNATMALLAEDSYDVGNVVLTPAPVVLGGIVLDEKDAPVPTLLVSIVDAENPNGIEDVRVGTINPVSTGRDGRFTVSSWTRSRDLSLRIDHRDYTPIRLEHVRPPSLDLRIVLSNSNTASIHFALLVDEECGRSLCGRAVRADGLAQLGPPFVSYTVNLKGEHVIRPVDAGEYQLEIFDRSTGVVVGRVDGLQVIEHRVCEDSRVNPIDLRGRLNCAKVWLVGKRGSPLANQQLTIRSGAGENQVFSDKDGCISVPNPTRSPGVTAIDIDGNEVPIVDGMRIVPHGLRPAQPRR
jgi:hypothetical protein